MSRPKAFMMYEIYDTYFSLLSDELAGKLIKLLFAFFADGEIKEDVPPELMLVYHSITRRMVEDAEHYAEVCEKRAAAGAVGGRKKPTND